MALLFSTVTATRESDKESKVFLARGIPKDYEDLEIYSSMDEILDGIDEETTITIETESFTYGEGGRYDATFEELAYMQMRMLDDDNFLEGHCTKVEENTFCIEYVPDELYRTILGVFEC